MCWPGSPRQAGAMNTNTVNPEALTTEPRYHTGSPFGTERQRAVLRRPVRDRMVAGVAAGLARYLGVDVMIVRIAFVSLPSSAARGSRFTWPGCC